MDGWVRVVCDPMRLGESRATATTAHGGGATYATPAAFPFFRGVTSAAISRLHTRLSHALCARSRDRCNSHDSAHYASDRCSSLLRCSQSSRLAFLARDRCCWSRSLSFARRRRPFRGQFSARPETNRTHREKKGREKRLSSKIHMSR